MSIVVVVFALLGALALGLVIGLAWRGMLLIGDRRALDRMSSQLQGEQRMQSATHATLQAMRQAARVRSERLHPDGQP